MSLPIADILASHALWLVGDPQGARADLRYADLRYADLSRADLRYAILSGADLNGVDARCEQHRSHLQQFPRRTTGHALPRVADRKRQQTSGSG